MEQDKKNMVALWTMRIRQAKTLDRAEELCNELIDNVEKKCNLGVVGKRIFIVFKHRESMVYEDAREVAKVFTSEVAAVTWIADNNPKKHYYEIHKVG
jgi:hypothetical protein